MSRYEQAFAALKAKNEGAFIPFYMLSDPSPEEAVEIIATAVEAGADALELGVPFSDPIADGPTVQKAHTRALDGGATIAKALDQIRELRKRYPDLPIGMLMYSNVPFVRGLDSFYQEFKEAGADSVLLADIPVREGKPFHDAAVANEIDPIFIAPYRASEETLEGVSAMSKGYIYAISRDGVTGAENQASMEGLDKTVQNVERFGGAPVVLGFGISTPQHVNDAITAGAAGAITGSALAKIVDKYIEYEHPNPGKITDMDALKAEVSEYVKSMKDATKL